MTDYMRVAHLCQTIELRANGFDALRDADGVMEDRLGSIYLVSALCAVYQLKVRTAVNNR